MPFPIQRIVKVIDGKVSLEVHADEGVVLLVTADLVPRKRSAKANRYWWSALMGALSEYTGDTPSGCHEWLVRRLRPVERTDPLTGEVFQSRARTSEMNSAEFAELCIEAQEICEKVVGLERISPEHYWNSLGGQTE